MSSLMGRYAWVKMDKIAWNTDFEILTVLEAIFTHAYLPIRLPMVLTFINMWNETTCHHIINALVFSHQDTWKRIKKNIKT